MKSRFPLKTKIKAMLKRKKKRKQGRNGDDYGQIPTGNGAENPVGGN
tara:strand:+ start:992 stop:1132 length:141 start_codon:yes stop_codon:yes gene_type:complete